MGNSEVGHQNIGAGRVVDQEIVRISKALSSGELATNPALNEIFASVRHNDSNLHLIGLLSSGGVHSTMEHPIALLRLAISANVERVFMHAILDGRDTPPQSGLGYIQQWESLCKNLGTGKIATVMGRFWAMDRDKRWNRVERAYNCLVGNTAASADGAKAAVKRHYEHPENDSQRGDEFLPPTWIGGDTTTIADGDGIVFFNFRGDRPREITRAFLQENFTEFPRSKRPMVRYATLTEYERGLCPLVLFPKPPPLVNTLGSYLSERGLRQFRTAETEKYAHVTFFFNDYREESYPGEERILIPSPTDVTTYDQRPEMSAAAVCDTFISAMRSHCYDFLVVNFANGDMVGHTGNLSAARMAVSTIDQCLGRIMEAADDRMVFLITSDHGNVEEMWDPLNEVPHTQHTTNPVELILFSKNQSPQLRDGGRLADIAPTILHLMKIPQPREMTGQNLLLPQ
jgi:2,3-bisphosphoglycerate-independent phosphoglycerate mutase